MKFSRAKKVNRYMQFFKSNYGFHLPYQVLIDGPLCLAALEAKVNLTEQLPKYFRGELKLLTTPCVVLELEKLGPTLYGALKVAKQFSAHRCGHEKAPISAALCLQSMLGSNNPGRYIIASQDPSLREYSRTIPGTPILYLYSQAPTLEKPSDYSVKKADSVVEKRIKSQGSAMERLRQLKEMEMGETSVGVKRIGKKRAKGPNPLSCMKKKKKVASSNQPPKDPNGPSKSCRRRNRKKGNQIISQVKQVLASQS